MLFPANLWSWMCEYYGTGVLLVLYNFWSSLSTSIALVHVLVVQVPGICALYLLSMDTYCSSSYPKIRISDTELHMRSCSTHDIPGTSHAYARTRVCLQSDGSSMQTMHTLYWEYEHRVVVLSTCKHHDEIEWHVSSLFDRLLDRCPVCNCEQWIHQDVR